MQQRLYRPAQQQQRPVPPTPTSLPPAANYFLVQNARRRPTVAQELDYFYNSNEPYQIYRHYEAPFGLVTMSDIEAQPIPDLYERVTGEVRMVRMESSEEEEQEEEEEDDLEEESKEEDEVLGKEEDWGNIEMIVRLPIERKACEIRARRDVEQDVVGEEGDSDKDALYEEDDDIDTDIDMEVASQATISPPPSTKKFPSHFRKDRTNTKKSRTTTKSRPRDTTIKMHKGTRPIPAPVQQAAAAIWAIKKNKDGLPTKTVLWTMDGFVKSKGHMQKDNPLRNWLGDERLFDGRTWAWLVGK